MFVGKKTEDQKAVKVKQYPIDVSFCHTLLQDSMNDYMYFSVWKLCLNAGNAITGTE
jgi:hypothetical protein